MSAGAPTLPLGLDPLIAEAKERARRRRFLVAAVLALAAAGATTHALSPFAGPIAGRSGPGTQSSRALAHLNVPIDATERHWRSTIQSLGGHATGGPAALRVRRRATAVVEKTGATVVRLGIWQGTSPAAVELVAATRMNPAAYLRHRAVTLVHAFRSPVYVKIVNGRGSYIFVWGGAANEGFAGTPPALENCSPVSNWSGFTRPPCPVR